MSNNLPSKYGFVREKIGVLVCRLIHDRESTMLVSVHDLLITPKGSYVHPSNQNSSNHFARLDINLEKPHSE